MKTELQDFCSEYSEFAAPLLQALDSSLEKVDAASRASLLGETRPVLADVQHRLKILVDKLEAQQAYLIIFGPLKSGKSTLMNAISGSYVSEVSSLPAYPCLVYVRDGEKQTYSTTSYGGRRQEFDDSSALQHMVDEKHAELALKLQEAEADGREFEPVIDFPDALRRVDISLPAADLAKSGVVLVDTPGLYSRMKFGYDLMTRDFRDAAACAVFVVKTENLFLEQVFAEFNELLDIFSRVFLVVNIDAGKKDLAPDGSLRPSAESAAPQSVVEAFESLAMDAPMRKALDEGRLNIYPIDLLSAAARRLSQEETDEQIAPAPFDGFLGDLSDYLNSSDYLVEFRRDSLNQGEMLAGELRQATSGEVIDSIRSRCEEESAVLEQLTKRRIATGAAGAIDWKASLAPSTQKLMDEVKSMASDAVAQLQRQFPQALDEWFENDNSLEELQEVGFALQINAEANRLADQSRGAVQRNLGGMFAGAELAVDARTALQLLQIDLMALGENPRQLLAADTFSIQNFELDVNEIPVQRGFFDYLFFRSPAKIRRLLFGPDGSSDIPARLKARRLGEAARENIAEQVAAYTRREVGEALESAVNELAGAHAEKLRTSVDAVLAGMITELDTRQEAVRVEIEEMNRLLGLVDGLSQTAAQFSERLDGMRSTDSPDSGDDDMESDFPVIDEFPEELENTEEPDDPEEDSEDDSAKKPAPDGGDLPDETEAEEPDETEAQEPDETEAQEPDESGETKQTDKEQAYADS